ncbi:MAG: LacI family DNA-binding transcriptional regulator [Christensenellales bacterium]|jgi:LacI family transcriptional regulator
MKKATIYDVAQKSGVSPATVSRVLNDTGYPVSKAAKEKVLKAAKVLEYEPNLLGKYLKTRTNKEIGVIIPNITNYYYPLLLLGVHDVAAERGYHIILCNSYRDPEMEIQNLHLLTRKQVMGILSVSLNTSNDYLQKFVDKGGNMVLLENSPEIQCNKVTFDYFQGGYLACKHLIELGHTKIGFAGAPLKRYSRIQQFEGYQKCLRDHGLEVNENFIYISQEEKESKSVYEFENGRFLARMLLESPQKPTALFCINDMTAIVMIQELYRNGVMVPQDISIVGFDNLNLSDVIIPSLTTVDQRIYEMGSSATNMLIDAYEKKTNGNRIIQLEPTLVVRDSTRSL